MINSYNAYIYPDIVNLSMIYVDNMMYSLIYIIMYIMYRSSNITYTLNRLTYIHEDRFFLIEY